MDLSASRHLSHSINTVLMNGEAQREGDWADPLRSGGPRQGERSMEDILSKRSRGWRVPHLRYDSWSGSVGQGGGAGRHRKDSSGPQCGEHRIRKSGFHFPGAIGSQSDFRAGVGTPSPQTHATLSPKLKPRTAAQLGTPSAAGTRCLLHWETDRTLFLLPGGRVSHTSLSPYHLEESLVHHFSVFANNNARHLSRASLCQAEFKGFWNTNSFSTQNNLWR